MLKSHTPLNHLTSLWANIYLQSGKSLCRIVLAIKEQIHKDLTMKRELQRSSAMYIRACELIPAGVNSPVRAFRKVGGHPLYIQTANGSTFTDVDGYQYIDFCQSWGPLILGHAHPQVVEAVQQAAKDGLSYGACHPRELAIAELLLEAMPELQKVRMVSSGTEAVMTALRISRGATGRKFTLKFDGGYHGHFDAMLVKAGSGLVTHAIADSSGVPESIANTTLVAPLDDEHQVAKLFELYGKDIAAVIIEPLPANNGLLIQRREFLAFLRDITLKYGSLLIFDEVISGFRLRYGGYYQEIGITPDLVTLGKIIGGGMPVGAVLGPAHLMDLLAPIGSVYQAGTLSGNPVSLAAGIATLQILKTQNPYPQLEALGKLLIDTLRDSGQPNTRAFQAGSILWLYLDQQAELPRRADAISTEAMQCFNRIYWPLLNQGFYLPPSPYEVMFLSTAHSQDQIKALAFAIANSLK